MAQLSQQRRDHAGAGVGQMLAELGLGAALHASQRPGVFGRGQPLQPGQGRLGTRGRPKAAVERAAKDSDVVPGDRRAEGQVVACTMRAVAEVVAEAVEEAGEVAAQEAVEVGWQAAY